MRMIQPPKIGINIFPEYDPPTKNYRLADLWKDKVIFDSDRLEYNPSSRFKDLTIGDFDLYAATAFIFASNEHPNYIKTEVECNRLSKHFRMKMIGLRDGMSYAELKKTGNIVEIESLFNVLDKAFGLIPDCLMSDSDIRHARHKIEDMLSNAWRVHNAVAKSYLKVFSPKIGIDVAGIDTALVLRGLMQRPAHIYDNWIRSLRGRRTYMSWYHPELFV